MSALNQTDFQCLQDQLVDLKTTNYELTEKNRRSQADFEAAKAKICSLQLKLEEQERDFQLTSSTLRREIETAYNKEQKSSELTNKEDDENYKIRYKKLLHKAKELQQRYDKSLEVVQQMDLEIKTLNDNIHKLEEKTAKLTNDLDDRDKQLSTQQNEYEKKLNSAIEECRSIASNQMELQTNRLKSMELERDTYKEKSEKYYDEIKELTRKLEQQSEETRIQDKKGSQIVKELKRQLASEKNKNETLQKRLENLLSSGGNEGNPENVVVKSINLSTSSSSTSATTNGNGSWSMLPANTGDKASKSNISICSIELSDDKEMMNPNISTISSPSQPPVVVPKISTSTVGDAKSESGSSNDTNHQIAENWLNSTSLTSLPNSMRQDAGSNQRQNRRDSNQNHYGNYSAEYGGQPVAMPMEEQIALMERLTRLQQDKWTLEEKLSYLEQSNIALSEELANKSDIIKHYFMNQTLKARNSNKQQETDSLPPFLAATRSSKMGSFLPANINQLLNDKSSLKKVVDFLKERSQQVSSSGDSQTITKEATKKMQLMLEETLIKCIKLEENLDFVTSELDKLKN